jgi:hypothetical protein
VKLNIFHVSSASFSVYFAFFFFRGDKIRIAKAQGVFSQLNKVWKNRKISSLTKIRILEFTVVTVVKYGCEALALRKTEEDLRDISQRN